MDHYELCIVIACASLLFGGIFAMVMTQKLSKQAPDGPLTAPDFVGEEAEAEDTCGCVMCDLDLVPLGTSLGFYHLHDMGGAIAPVRCTRDWSHSCQ